MANAQSIAFADRDAYLGDADFVDVPLDMLLNKTYLASRWEVCLCVEYCLRFTVPWFALL